jgi:hypothetical protein
MPKTFCWKAIGLLIFALSANFASAENPPAMVNAPDAPVKLVSITSTLSDFLSVVTTRNVSSKVVKSFQLGIIMSVPQGCGPVEVFGEEQVQPIDRVDLAAGESVQTKSYRLAPESIHAFGIKNHADLVQSQLTVVRVDFADGTSWSVARSAPIYDVKLLVRTAAIQCSESH